MLREQGLLTATVYGKRRTMFKIGDFARLTRLSVKTLRYYDEIGLLPAAQTDRWTGYRYYSAAQLPRLNRILALRDLGLSLDQIGVLLTTDLPAAEIQGMLRLKQAELQAGVAEGQTRLARVAARIAQIEQEGTLMTAYEVIVKPVAAQRVAERHGVIPNEAAVNATFNRLFDEACAYVEQHGGRFTGPGIAVWYEEMVDGMQNVPVAAAMPTDSPLPDSDGVTVHDLPAATMACAVHHGAFDGLGAAYDAITRWIAASGYRIAGPNREIYLEYDRTGNPAAYVTEIQFPVTRTEGAADASAK